MRTTIASETWPVAMVALVQVVGARRDRVDPGMQRCRDMHMWMIRASLFRFWLPVVHQQFALLLIQNAVLIHAEFSSPLPTVTWNDHKLLPYVEQ